MVFIALPVNRSWHGALLVVHSLVWLDGSICKKCVTSCKRIMASSCIRSLSDIQLSGRLEAIA